MGSRKAAVLYGLAQWAYIGEQGIWTFASLGTWVSGPSGGAGLHTWTLAAGQAMQVVLVAIVVVLGYGHLRGQLHVPETRLARLGYALVLVGFTAWIVKVVALAVFLRAGANMLAFIAYGPLNLATTAILAGAGLVELARIRTVTGSRNAEAQDDRPARLAARSSAPPLARVRRSTGVDWSR
jgi:hypothetical protein